MRTKEPKFKEYPSEFACYCCNYCDREDATAFEVYEYETEKEGKWLELVCIRCRKPSEMDTLDKLLCCEATDVVEKEFRESGK